MDYIIKDKEWWIDNKKLVCVKCKSVLGRIIFTRWVDYEFCFCQKCYEEVKKARRK